MILLAAMLLAPPAISPEQARDMQRAHFAWQACIKSEARRLARSSEIPETVVRGAYGKCERQEDALAAVSQRYLGDDAMSPRQLRRAWSDKLIALIIEARQQR